MHGRVKVRLVSCKLYIVIVINNKRSDRSTIYAMLYQNSKLFYGKALGSLSAGYIENVQEFKMKLIWISYFIAVRPK